MDLEDKTLQCVECGESFTFTVAEQEFFASRGYTNEPKRCSTCREARQNRTRSGGYDSYGYRAPREMHPVVCASCGKDTEVPFEPRQGRPVYCSDCYSRMRPVSGRR
jgi:CxxC-x17-CxxC domain-containing protein